MRGFTLIELSIVLMIIGLLVGAGLVGYDMVKAAELRSVLRQVEETKAAVKTFRLKYNCLPGDCKNATFFFGVAAGNGNDTTCYQTIQTTKATCNGNGDKSIGLQLSGSPSENYLFWKHLGSAELIEGNFTGAHANLSGHASYNAYLTGLRIDLNTPGTARKGSFFDVKNNASWNAALQKGYGVFASGVTPHSYYKNSLWWYQASPTFPWAGAGPVTILEAKNIDTKVDDGRPGKGWVEVLRGGNIGALGPCLTSANPRTAEYNVANSDEYECTMIFVGALD